jgi:prephenate dehydrogenase
MGALSNDAPFRRIAIVGLGLIGGSIALALRTRWPGVRLLGVDRASVLGTAQARGAIDKGFLSVSLLGRVDAVILAAPVGQNIDILASLSTQLEKPAIITDVGSTKRNILLAAKSLPDRLMFVGGHPLSGSASSGFNHARGSLFYDRPWILTPESGTNKEALARVTALAHGLGARPLCMDAEEHDRVMAFVSHLPQIVASALMEVAGREVSPDGLALAGAGLTDTTRLASSSAAIWNDVCESNADTIGIALDVLIDRLSEVKNLITKGKSVDSVFEEAVRWRKLLTGRQKTPTGN